MIEFKELRVESGSAAGQHGRSGPAQTSNAADAAAIPAFETTVHAVAASHRPATALACDGVAGRCVNPVDRARTSQRAFEAFALQTFIESMLPDETTKLFGSGSAGKMWKSLLAEKLAAQIADSGQLNLTPATTRGASVSAPAPVAPRPPTSPEIASRWVTDVTPASPTDELRSPQTEPTATTTWTTDIR